jgi:ABC-type transporter Mla subunit MlaD
MADAFRSGAAAPDSPISGLVDQAQTIASSLAANAQDTARRLAEEQKNAAAAQVEDVARVIETAAEQVERLVPEAAPYVREAADRVHDFSSMVRDQSIDDVIGAVEGFARARPALFVAGSVLAGLALARFLKASTDRREFEASSSQTRAATSRKGGARGARSQKSSAAKGSGRNAEGPAAAGGQE